MNPDWKKEYARYKAFLAHLSEMYRQRADMKAYLEIILSLVTVSVFALFALRPTLLTIAQLMKDIETKKQTLVVLNKKIEDLARAQSLYEQYRNQIQVLNSAIAKTNEPDAFFRQVEGVAGIHQTTVSNVAMDEGVVLGTTPEKTDTQELPANAKGYEGNKFSITTTAPIDGYKTLYDFLTDIEKIRKPFVIEEVRVKRNQENNNQEAELVMFIRGEIPYLLYNPNTQ
jgi:hypothetical protein